MEISRRRFLQSSLAISALSVLPACSVNRSTDPQGRYVYDITAEPATAELVPGYQTKVLGFNGRFQLLRFAVVRVSLSS